MTMHHESSDPRILRERLSALQGAVDRAGRRPATGARRQLVRVFAASTLPTTPDTFFAAHPCEAAGDESEGATPSFDCDENTTLFVDFIRKAPKVDDMAVATLVGGRWVAEVGGKSSPACQWFCGAAVGIANPDDPLGADALATLTVGDGGVITSVALAYPGTRYTAAHPRVTIAGGGSGAAAVATVGEVTSIAVTAGGSGYSAASPPAVTIDAPGGSGATATATATVDGSGAVSGLTITSGGSLYTTDSPAVTIAPPASGDTATATATAKPGAVTSLVLTAGGSGYIDPSVPPYLNLTLSSPTWSVACKINLLAPDTTPPDRPPPKCRYGGETIVDFPGTAATAPIPGVIMTAGAVWVDGFGWNVTFEVFVAADPDAPYACPGCIEFGPSPVDGTIYGLVASPTHNIGPAPTQNINTGPYLIGFCPSRPYSASYTYQIVPAGCSPTFPADSADWYVLCGGTCPNPNSEEQPPVPLTLTVSEP
jgi:hypothetical protein